MELKFHVKFLTSLDFHQIEFSLKLDFLKIEFQNRDILLDNFRTGTFCYIFWAKGANGHFSLSIYIYIYIYAIIHSTITHQPNDHVNQPKWGVAKITFDREWFKLHTFIC